MTSRKTAKDLTVPELDKGDHQNKRNLCDFLEQEEIAQRMLKEAHDFYTSFLRSKSVLLSEILQYPGVFFVRPVVSAYWCDIKVDKYGNIKPLTGKGNKVCIVVSFDSSYGCAPNGTLISELCDMADNYRRHNSDDFTKTDRNYYFKDYKIAKDIYQQYYDFLYSGEYNEVSNTMRCRKSFVMTVEEISKFVGKSKRRKDNLKWLDWIDEQPDEDDEEFYEDECYEYDDCFETDTMPAILYEYLSDESKILYASIPYAYRDHFERGKERRPDMQKLRAIPQVEEFIQEHLPILNETYKANLKAMIDNYKYGHSLGKRSYLITRGGKPVELTTEDIADSEVDKKTGMYTVVTKELTERHPEYAWPSDCDLIVTDYHQKFVFDIATNDLVNYQYVSYTHRESRKHRY